MFKYIIPFVLMGCFSCQPIKEEKVSNAFIFHETLSEYGFFEGNLANLNPIQSVLSYELNSSLFTDYAYKARFIQLPEGEKMQYKGGDLPEFPEGTILIKNFYYHHDERNLSAGRKIIETRLLVKDEGVWKVGTYIWNDEQTEANHELLGKSQIINWIDKSGTEKQVNYKIPDNNDCKSCHKKNGIVSPIGPKIKNLNVDFASQNGVTNQLALFAVEQKLEGLPNDLEKVDQLPVWDDERYTVEERARAYLDVNCAHCHSAGGPATNTALNLNYEEKDLHKLGVCKGPVSAAQGSGNLRFDIVPGNADQSIIYYRMRSAETGVAMPELGKSLVHAEGVALIKAWIDRMEAGACQ